MQTQWPLQDAKNKFSQVVDGALQGMPQVVTRRGVPVVVVVAVEQYDLLTQKGRNKEPVTAEMIFNNWGENLGPTTSEEMDKLLKMLNSKRPL